MSVPHGVHVAAGQRGPTWVTARGLGSHSWDWSPIPLCVFFPQLAWASSRPAHSGSLAFVHSSKLPRANRRVGGLSKV